MITQERFFDLLQDMEEEAREYVKSYGTDAKALAQIIKCNKSTWTGGSYSYNNLKQSIIRDVAIEELYFLLRRTKGTGE